MVTTRSSPVENYEEKRQEMQKALDAVIEEFDLQKILTEKRRRAILDFLLEETVMDSHPHRLIRKNIATSYIYNYVNTVYCQDFIPSSYFQRLQLCPWGNKRTRKGIKSAFGPPRRSVQSVKYYFIWAFRQCKCPPIFLQRGKELIERYFSPWASHKDIRGIVAGLMTYLYAAECKLEPFTKEFPLSYRDYIKIFHTSEKKVRAWFNRFVKREQQRIGREETEQIARDRQWAEFQELRRKGKAKGIRVAEELLGFPLTRKSYFILKAADYSPIGCSLARKKELLARILRKFPMGLSIHDFEDLITYWRTHQDLNQGWLGPDPDLFWQIYLFTYCAHRVIIPLYEFRQFIDRHTFYISLFYSMKAIVPDFENSKHDMTAAWHWIQRAFKHLPAAPKRDLLEFPRVYDQAAHPELGDFLQLFKIDSEAVCARKKGEQFGVFFIWKSQLLKLFHKEYQVYKGLRKDGWHVILGHQGPHKLGHFLFHPESRQLARLDLETLQLQELRVKCAWDGYIFVEFEGRFYFLHPIAIHFNIDYFELDLRWKSSLFGIRQPLQWEEKLLWVDWDLEEKLQVLKDFAWLMSSKVSRLSTEFILYLFTEVEKRRGKCLTSGVKEVDWMLGFGFRCGTLFEIYGPDGAGKTTLLHQLACTAALPMMEHGLDTSTIFIDLDGSLSIRRLQQIATRFKISPQELYKKITIIQPASVDELLYFCEFQLERLAKERKARFICLDSISTPFLREYAKEIAYEEEPLSLGENENLSYFKKGRRIIRALRRVIHAVDGVGIFTNGTKVTSPRRYLYWTHHCLGQLPDVRISMRRFGDRWRIALRMAKDCFLSECVVKLVEGGFVDDEFVFQLSGRKIL